MPEQASLEKIKSLYDDRAPTYDSEKTGCHAEQAQDYIRWMTLEPGQNVLDLACGTGPITIPAKQAVGSSGTVIGIDISGVSLSLAREKAEKLNLDIKFLEHDISNLDGIEGMKEGFFDVIMCAAAFSLLEDPGAAVKNWAKLLKKSGKLILDVPTDDSMIQRNLLSRVAKELDSPIAHDQTRLDTAEKINKLLEDAGLDTGESFVTKNYMEVKPLDPEKARDMYDSLTKNYSVFKIWFPVLDNLEKTAAAKEIFSKEMKKLAGPDGKVHQQLKFYMAVGKNL
ncbi:hypothetical protein G7Y89_g7553 [Cudoniella acicularis]|uniref:Methyltransferase domain-containing protein n=1 Tax=Cudoniella acicularis TaxID=354080 RepID=A0A8H4RLU8_9HELO|nr:hypothetical protein G7Y89_g7553 [Cudoniella acicularis]